MIKTENPGILEAIREVRIMGLGRSLWAVGKSATVNLYDLSN